MLAKLALAKKRPKLGIHIPKPRDDNQSCHILTVIFNWINQLQIPQSLSLSLSIYLSLSH